LIAAILAAAMIVGQSPVSDRGTWYGARCPSGVVSLGRTDTCSPYVSIANGGRGGETKWYAAVGWFRYGMKPVSAVITSKITGRSVRVQIRDYCRACDKNRALVDMSPWVFIALGHELGRGTTRVSIRYEGVR